MERRTERRTYGKTDGRTWVTLNAPLPAAGAYKYVNRKCGHYNYCSGSWWDGCRGVPKSTHDAPVTDIPDTPLNKEAKLKQNMQLEVYY